MGSPNLAIFHTVELLGFYVSPVLFWAAISLLPYSFARQVMKLLDLYRFVWHPPAFNLSLYVVIAGSAVLVMGRT